ARSAVQLRATELPGRRARGGSARDPTGDRTVRRCVVADQTAVRYGPWPAVARRRARVIACRRLALAGPATIQVRRDTGGGIPRAGIARARVAVAGPWRGSVDAAIARGRDEGV